MVEQTEQRKRHILITSATFPYKALEASRALVLSFFPQDAVGVQVVCLRDEGLSPPQAGLWDVIRVELRGKARERLQVESDEEVTAPLSEEGSLGAGRSSGTRTGSEEDTDPGNEPYAGRVVGGSGRSALSGLSIGSAGFSGFVGSAGFPGSEGSTGSVGSEESEGSVWAGWELCSIVDDGGNLVSSSISAKSLPERFATVSGGGWSSDPGNVGLEGNFVIETELGSDELRQILRQPRPGRETLLSITLKLVLLKLLSKVTGTELPWGILTGIRPTKLLHRLSDQGVSANGQRMALQVLYAVRQDKIALLQSVATVQVPYLEQQRRDPKKVGVYVGIPFCPSRCTYCSFPGYHLSEGRTELQGYLESLREEVKAAGRMMFESGLEGDTLYFGGGTPSILTEQELEELLAVCRAWLPLQKGIELSFEAGRPDTLSEEKLRVLAELGVTRLSINPQSMQDATLRRIGRAHTVQSVLKTFQAARQLVPWIINMDLIIGLPGEGEAEMRSTLSQLDKLRPDNLTVHAFALKRGAKESEWGYEHPDALLAAQMQAMAFETASSWGLRPYYLYRQKHMAGNSENIGYAQPGKESRYNIAIMEERQSIIGLGAGASSKVVNPVDYSLVNLQHPSNWQVYRTRWPDLQVKRAVEFSRIYG